MDYFLCVIGMVLIVEGLPWFTSPPDMRKVVEKIALMPDKQLRIMGFLMIAGGLLLVFFGRR